MPPALDPIPSILQYVLYIDHTCKYEREWAYYVMYSMQHVCVLCACSYSVHEFTGDAIRCEVLCLMVPLQHQNLRQKK